MQPQCHSKLRFFPLNFSHLVAQPRLLCLFWATAVYLVCTGAQAQSPPKPKSATSPSLPAKLQTEGEVNPTDKTKTPPLSANPTPTALPTAPQKDSVPAPKSLSEKTEATPPAAAQEPPPAQTLVKPPKPAPPTEVLSTDPRLKDEETPSQVITSVSDLKYPGVRLVELTEEISAFTSPLQISKVQPKFVFVGKSQEEWSIYMFDPKDEKARLITPMKDGYMGIPLGFDDTNKQVLVQIQPLESEDEWHTNVTRLAKNEVSLGLLHVQKEQWQFLKFPFGAWVDDFGFLLGLSPREPHLYVSNVIGDVKRFIAPTQDPKTSLEKLQAFAIKPPNTNLILWTDHCRPRGEPSPECLWMTPIFKKQTVLPKVHSVLPAKAGPKALWHIDNAGSILVLTLWDPGAKLVTRRWWTRVKNKEWFPLWQGTFSDPKAHTVIINRPPVETSFYFLTSSNGANTRLTMRDIRHADRKILREKSQDVGIPFPSDLFPLDSKNLLSISQSGIRVIDTSVAF